MQSCAWFGGLKLPSTPLPSRGPLENQMESLDAMQAASLLLLRLTLEHGAELLDSEALPLGPEEQLESQGPPAGMDSLG